MGRWIADAGLVPEIVAVSPARRAMETLQRAQKAGDWHCKVAIWDHLYETSPEVVIHHLQQFDAGYNRLMLVGHEPTWSALVGILTGARAVMPTCAMACVSFDAESWTSVAAGRGTLRWLITPDLF